MKPPQQLVSSEFTKMDFQKKEMKNKRHIRIKIEPIFLEEQSDINRIYYINTVLGEVMSILHQTIKVTGPTTIPPFDTNECFNTTGFPSKFNQTETDTDFILFALLEDLSEEYLAMAGSCMMNDYNSRPVVGAVIMNSKYLQPSHQNLEMLKSTLLHEMMHALGFTSRSNLRNM